MKVACVGYPFILSRNYKMLDKMADQLDIAAMLPKKWEYKGQLLYPPGSEKIEIIPLKPTLYHSEGHLFGAFRKGMMWGIYNEVKKRECEIDLIYTMMEPNNLLTLYTAFIAKLFNLKHVFFMFENKIPERKGFGKIKQILRDIVQKINIKGAHGIIAGNLGAKKILMDLGCHEKKIIVLPQAGIDIEFFSPSAKPLFKKKLESRNKTIILFAGALDKRKGLDILINSAPSLLRYNKNIHLLIVGTGPLENHLKKQVVEKNLKDYFTFIKWLDYSQMPNLYASCDIFVYPSVPTSTWEEQMGYSMIEAMACGKPVVSTLTGSIPEVVADKETGFLVKPNNVKELSNALLKLVKNYPLRKKMGSCGRKRVKERFSNEIVANKTSDFLKSIGELK